MNNARSRMMIGPSSALGAAFALPARARLALALALALLPTAGLGNVGNREPVTISSSMNRTAAAKTASQSPPLTMVFSDLGGRDMVLLGLIMVVALLR